MTELRFAFVLAAIASLSLVACSDSDDDTGAENTTTESTTAPEANVETGAVGAELTCTKELLEGDFGAEPLAGPGVNPETGELLPQAEPFIVSTTYLALQGTPEAQETFGQLVEARPWR